MRLVLTGRNVEISPTLRQLVDGKLGRLERVLNDSAVSAQVILSTEKYRHIAEVTVHARGDHMLHGVGGASNWPSALKQAVEKIAQQAKKIKGKWTTRKRRAIGRRSLAAGRPETVSAVATELPRIVRTPPALVKPMTVEDAALRVGTTQQSFVVFRNASTDSINILYRRSDGQLGLIDPEA